MDAYNCHSQEPISEGKKHKEIKENNSSTTQRNNLTMKMRVPTRKWGLFIWLEHWGGANVFFHSSLLSWVPPTPHPPTPTPPGPKPFPQSPTPTQRGLCLDRGQMVYDCWPPHRQRGEGWPKTNANNYNFQCKWPSDMGWSWIISTLTFWVLASSYQPSFSELRSSVAEVFKSMQSWQPQNLSNLVLVKHFSIIICICLKRKCWVELYLYILNQQLSIECWVQIYLECICICICIF